MSGWTQERRERQAELIRQWQPWTRSTGPRTEAGKAKVARNAWRGGHRERLREVARLVSAELRVAKENLGLVRQARTSEL